MAGGMVAPKLQDTATVQGLRTAPMQVGAGAPPVAPRGAVKAPVTVKPNVDGVGVAGAEQHPVPGTEAARMAMPPVEGAMAPPVYNAAAQYREGGAQYAPTELGRIANGMRAAVGMPPATPGEPGVLDWVRSLASEVFPSPRASGMTTPEPLPAQIPGTNVIRVPDGSRAPDVVLGPNRLKPTTPPSQGMQWGELGRNIATELGFIQKPKQTGPTVSAPRG